MARCTEWGNYTSTNVAVKEKITEMDWDFLIGTTEILIRCKKVLKYSYVLAYFAKTDKTKENEIQLLALMQEQLEKCVKELTHLLKQDTKKLNCPNINSSSTLA